MVARYSVHAYVTAFSILSFICVTSNLLACYIIYRRKTTRNPAKWYLFSLAVTDLIVGAISMPFLIWLFVMKAQMNRETAPYFAAYEVVEVITEVASILHLCIISIDRAVAIIKPLFHRRICTKQNVLKSLTIPWLTGLIFGGLYFVAPDSREFFLSYFLILAVLFFLVPVAIMSVSYTCIFIHIRRRNMISMVARKTRINEWRLARTFLIIIVVFVICWTPFVIVTLIHVIKAYLNHQKVVAQWKFVMIKFMQYLSSASNPFIYAIFHQNFRTAIWDIFKRCCYRRTGKEDKAIDRENVAYQIALKHCSSKF